MNETADAWLKAAGMLLILNGLTFAIGAAIVLIFGIFFPGSMVETLPPDMAGQVMLFGIVSAVLYVLFAALSVLVGIGIWNYKPWARNTMIISGWIVFVIGLLVILVAFIPSDYGQYSTDLLLTGVLFVALSAIQIRYFQYDSVVREHFAKPMKGMGISFKPERQIVKAWAVCLGVSAASLLLAAILIVIVGPRAAQVLPIDVPSMTFVLFGLAFAALGGIFLAIAVGIWRLRRWARMALLTVTWLTIVLLPFYAYLHWVIGGSPFDITNVFLQTLFYAVLQLWLFQFSPVKKAFKV